MIKVKDDIDLEKLCIDRWGDKGNKYEICDNLFNKYISINKTTRMVVNYGFTWLLNDMIVNVIIEFI